MDWNEYQYQVEQHRQEKEDREKEMLQLIINMESTLHDLSSSCDNLSAISTQLMQLLSEQRKTNVWLKMLVRLAGKDEIITSAKPYKSQNPNNYVNKNLILLGDSFEQARQFAEQIAAIKESILRIASSEDVSGKIGLTALLSRCISNEYLLIDINYFNSKCVDILYRAIKDSELDFSIGQGKDKTTVDIALEKFHCIIYSDMLELIDPRLRDIMEVVTL
ncbi:MAG: hypothetical protein NC132_05655 [Corallococcus sp.]|nr:hypothetical protein [Corallococcus sp.]MCM1360017.1 hypothetical protein [Corallococcus sp.]MCM1395574.1 hypothetical protein [Corallococcus sp.]